MAPRRSPPLQGLQPTVASMIDYQGGADGGQPLGFDYDDVPFEFPSN